MVVYVKQSGARSGWEGQRPYPFTRQKVKRSGMRPLIFDGVLLFELSADSPGHEKISVWEARQGFVLQLAFSCEVSGINMSHASHFETAGALLEGLKSFDPTSPLIGGVSSLLQTDHDGLSQAIEHLQDLHIQAMDQHSMLVAAICPSHGNDRDRMNPALNRL